MATSHRMTAAPWTRKSSAIARDSLTRSNSPPILILVTRIRPSSNHHLLNQSSKKNSNHSSKNNLQIIILSLNLGYLRLSCIVGKLLIVAIIPLLLTIRLSALTRISLRFLVCFTFEILFFRDTEILTLFVSRCLKTTQNQSDNYKCHKRWFEWAKQREKGSITREWIREWMGALWRHKSRIDVECRVSSKNHRLEF